MESFFDKRMSAGWKVSFIISVLILVLGVVEESILDAFELFVYSLMLVIWVTARWITIGKQASDDGSE